MSITFLQTVCMRTIGVKGNSGDTTPDSPNQTVACAATVTLDNNYWTA